MIDYKIALKIAQKRKNNIDKCSEYENGYVFGANEDDNYVGGAGHTPIVVIKENGDVIPMNAFVMRGTGKLIKSFAIKQ